VEEIGGESRVVMGGRASLHVGVADSLLLQLLQHHSYVDASHDKRRTRHSKSSHQVITLTREKKKLKKHLTVSLAQTHALA
jgi:hypothetical protein